MSDIGFALQMIVSARSEIKQKLPQIYNELGQDWTQFIEQINSQCTELATLEERVGLLAQKATNDTANLEDIYREFEQIINTLLTPLRMNQTLEDILIRSGPSDSSNFQKHPLDPSQSPPPDDLRRAIIQVHAVANEFILFDKKGPDKDKSILQRINLASRKMLKMIRSNTKANS